MSNLTLEDSIASREILERNKIIIPEIKRVLKDVEGKVILYYFIEEEPYDFGIGLGEFYCVKECYDKKAGSFYFKDSTVIKGLADESGGFDRYLWVYSENLKIINYEEEYRFMGRIVSPQKKILFEDEEIMKKWDGKYLKWKTDLNKINSFLPTEEMSKIRSLTFPYGMELPNRFD